VFLYLTALTYNLLVLKRFFFKAKYLQLLIWTVIYSAAATGVDMLLYHIYPKFDADFEFLIYEFFTIIIVILIGIPAYFFFIWLNDNVVHKEEQLSRSEAELKFLKLQLNPHFLLNAMNNLYGTSLQTPELIPEKILQLSSLLRYQINATKVSAIELQKEIDFVSEYISYQTNKINNLAVNVSVNGSAEALFVRPLLFLTLIENAFKHSAACEFPSVTIAWNIIGNELTFNIENNFVRREAGGDDTTKIGIRNLKRRLAISYPESVYQITDFNNIYKVKLHLCLSNSTA
jgi:two-component system, LytTR family, sensor kinase